MPKQIITINNHQHADVMAAVGGQNGLNVTGVGVYFEGQLIDYDEVRLEADAFELKVRSTPEKEADLADMIRARNNRLALTMFGEEEADAG